MIAQAEIRRIALAQSEAVEQDHHGFPSFRVGGKIFCTLRENQPRMMVKLEPEDQHNLVEAHPSVIEPVPGSWGRKGSTYVDLSGADEALATMLIKLAWMRVAPKRLKSGS